MAICRRLALAPAEDSVAGPVALESRIARAVYDPAWVLARRPEFGRELARCQQLVAGHRLSTCLIMSICPRSEAASRVVADQQHDRLAQVPASPAVHSLEVSPAHS